MIIKTIGIGCSVIFLALAARPAMAPVQVGTGAYGGLCFGPYCGPGTPPNVGTGAYGGLCYGPYCGPAANSEQGNSLYQPNPSVQPSQPQYPQSAGEDYYSSYGEKR